MKRTRSLRTTLTLYAVLSTLVVGGTGFLSQMAAQVFIDDFSTIMHESEPYLRVQERASKLMEELEAYLDTRSHSSLKNYWAVSEELRIGLEELPHPVPTKKSAHLKLDLLSVASAYLKTTEEVLGAKRSRKSEVLASAYARADRILSYIQLLTGEIVQEDYRESSLQRRMYQRQSGYFRVSAFIVLAGVIVLGLLTGYWFSSQLTNPLETMAISAGFMSRGDYGYAITEPSGPRELVVLARAFESMRVSVETHLAQERKQAFIERGFLEQKMENLRIRHLLEQAEYQALQAQINPHFLFNTLHTGIQLAIIEDADQTRLYIENLAAVFKHNLRSLEKPVSFFDEISSIERYIAIMRIRFGDRFTFRLNVPEVLPQFLMPAMILQPLVENAINHGLRDCEEGGVVEIGLVGNLGGLSLWVSDNGVGIPQALVEQLSQHESLGDVLGKNGSTFGRKSNGIGLSNVLERMALFFGGSKNWTILSAPGKGTTIRFTLNLKGAFDV